MDWGQLAGRLFRDRFGHAPAVVVRAPGRVNLIGDHTDYTGGSVLPMAIDRQVVVAAGAREDGQLVAYSEAFGQTLSAGLGDSVAANSSSWMRYVVGVATSLKRRIPNLPGATMWIGGDLPHGAGLASSAALEVATARAMLGLANEEVPDIELAEICQRAEHEFAGAPCGIMDQLACVMSRKGRALFLDCTSLETKHVAIPWENAGVGKVADYGEDNGHALVVVDTGVKHEIASGEYARRRSECADALRLIREKNARVRTWRDLDEKEIDQVVAGMPVELARRVRHVVTENARVVDAVHALERRDLATFGQLMSRSHESLRDDFEVSCLEVDMIVDCLSGMRGVLGARMTGGGFGGCVIALVERASLARVEKQVKRSFSGSMRDFFEVRSARGAEVVARD